MVVQMRVEFGGVGLISIDRINNIGKVELQVSWEYHAVLDEILI